MAAYNLDLILLTACSVFQCLAGNFGLSAIGMFC